MNILNMTIALTENVTQRSAVSNRLQRHENEAIGVKCRFPPGIEFRFGGMRDRLIRLGRKSLTATGWGVVAMVSASLQHGVNLR